MPPSPSRQPVLGNFHQLGLLPHRNLRYLAQKHGPIMLLYLGSVPTLVLSSVDAAREVMKICIWEKYSEEGSGKEFKKLLKQFLELLGSYSFADFVPWLGWVDRISGLDAKMDRVSKEVDEFLQGVIQEHVNKQELHLGVKDVQLEHKEDFVDMLLRIQKETTHGMSIENDTVKAILLDIYAAGTAITATILEWAMSELLRHPYAMSTVQRKMREILGCRPELTDGDLEKMQHLRAVIKETLRLHLPMLLLIPRSAREDVKVNGYDIAAGTMVTTNAWDPATWNEPEEFQPARFFNSYIDFRGKNFQLIPFGAGRRGRPGIVSAMATNAEI
ncbi:hypothetical protein POM88_038761 [Heracleum sosnowskyi]|uniref:Cytochrome P450 n=1 Tax=Heracleum sosnowskyi TaxID=360622 RepID=A0AAD8H946_9APIA|nr:hypothetical protein POM88_038761 [Heracleum sosnowskyi]